MPLAIKNCPGCGRLHNNQGICCSMVCARKYRKLHGDLQYEPRFCPVCGKKHIRPVLSNKTFCSRTCGNIGRKKRDYTIPGNRHLYQYKEKICPTCGIIHKHKGPFCSRAHMKKVYVRTPEGHKRNLEGIKRYNNSPEGINARNKHKKRLTEFPIMNPPQSNREASELKYKPVEINLFSIVTNDTERDEFDTIDIDDFYENYHEY